MNRNTAKLLLIAASAAALGACSSAFNGPEHALSVAQTHPISVDSQIVTLTLDVDTSSDELSAIDSARVGAFADSYLRQGHGTLTVTSPDGAENDRAGQETAADVRKALNARGVPWESITGASYRTGEPSNEIILSYTQYVATASECGDWSGGLSRKYRNLRSANFGCATMSNYAAMIADPHDLIAPADQIAPDAQARVRGVALYREGEVTASESDGEIEAQISN